MTSRHPLITHPGVTAVLPPRLFAPIGWYAALAACGHAVVDTSRRYDRREKAVHRYDIVDVRGPLSLTVPVASPAGCDGQPTWNDVSISRHGRWWHVHRVTLESAYGRTPYFEFVIDRFSSLFEDPGEQPPSALDYARRADEAVRSFLGLETDVEWRPATAADAGTLDLRHRLPDTSAMPPYFQVRSSALGFVPSLSILDAVFNLGPEAPLYLKRLISAPGIVNF